MARQLTTTILENQKKYDKNKQVLLRSIKTAANGILKIKTTN